MLVALAGYLEFSQIIIIIEKKKNEYTKWELNLIHSTR